MDLSPHNAFNPEREYPGSYGAAAMKMNSNLRPPLIQMPDGKLMFRTELVIAQERIKKLEADLEECREFLEGYSDVVDGDYGQPEPNKAMRLCSMIDESLHGAGAV